MLNSLSSFLFNKVPSHEETLESKEDDSSYRMQELDEEWLIVDPIERLSDEASGPTLAEKEGYEEVLPSSKRLQSNNCPLSPLENQPSPPPSPSQQMDGSWYVTPPPCFTAGSPAYLETSPLENLLIEHPSMSVYGPVSNFSFLNMRRSESPCFEQSISEETKENNAQQTMYENAENRSVNVRLEHHHRGHQTSASRRKNRQFNRSISTNLEAVALEERLLLVQTQKVQYHLEQRKLKGCHLERQNRNRQYKSTKGHPQRKNQMLMQPVKSNRKC